jgi:hypothetical protein
VPDEWEEHRRPVARQVLAPSTGARRIWLEFANVVVPARPVDLVIDTEAIDPDRVCERIHAHVEDPARDQSRS